MTDAAFIEKELRREIRERKTLGYSARHKINGSKSKRAARLSSDHLTPKQLRERNGEVMTYNLSKPIEWKVFKTIPEDLQKQYIQNLVEKYELTQHALCEMFGVTRVPLSNMLERLGLQDIFPRGRKMSAQNIIAFNAFMHPIEELDTNVVDEPCTGEMSLENTEADEVSKDAAMVMAQAQFTFCGNIDVNQVANTLRQCIPSKTNVKLVVCYEVLQ